MVTAELTWLLRGNLVPDPVSPTIWLRLAWALLGAALLVPMAWRTFQQSCTVLVTEMDLTLDHDHWLIQAATALLLLVLPILIVWHGSPRF